ncbi:MAG: glutamate 5-kinase [Coriobacteriia bacterium]|nr:glutamate 5-kinase [Coriobacteriia bacterium]
MSKRIVIKVGSNTLTNEYNKLDHHFIATLVEQIADLCRQGHEVVLVSSGAIAAGLEVLNLDKRPTDIPSLQACASVGQVALVEMYGAQFGRRGFPIGQVLLTKPDTENEVSYAHAKDTFERLLALGAIPIVNENDTVAVEEIAFGDNDTLAALVAEMIGADHVVILTDIDGYYDKNPMICPDAQLVERVAEVSEEMIEDAGDSGSGLGSGGMRTKLEAAKSLLDHEITMTLCDGRCANVVVDAVAGSSSGTVFDHSLVE